jgi:hypothetical protein
VRTPLLVSALFASLSLSACLSTDYGETEAEAKGGPKKAAQLNLSHLECQDDGTVQAHFVLLFAGNEQPGQLTGTWSGGTFGPVDSYKHTGNVWHYEVFLPAGDIDILSASVDGVSLHNPGDYGGNYVCDGDTDSCPIVVEAGSQCLPVLGNEGSECGHFGLNPIGKDDGLTGLQHTATMDAYVAIVKSGKGSCGQQENSYNVIVGVQAGDTLDTPFDQNISHVTYCECPSDL